MEDVRCRNTSPQTTANQCRCVSPEVRRRLRLAAAKRDDFRCRQYVIEAIEEQLREDLGEDDEGVMTLTAKADTGAGRTVGQFQGFRL